MQNGKEHWKDLSWRTRFMKYIKLNATIEVPDDLDALDLMNSLTDAIEANNCEWCAGMSYDKDMEDNNERT
jgi:hypothetical protein